MKHWKEIIKSQMERGKDWIRQHPSIIVITSIIALLCGIQICINGLCFSSTEIFSMEAISDVLFTATEVIAGLYGLTLTGYIFFLDRLQQKADDDELLEDIIALLKKRYHNMVLILSALCFIVILSAFSFIIYRPESGILPDYTYNFWGYETLFFVFVVLSFNIYFVIIVVDPDKIPRVSLQYKQKLSNSDTEFGSLQEFLQDYEDIEQILMEKSQGMAISQIGTNPWKAIKHLNGKERIEMRKLLNDPLLKKLTILGQYYSYMVFSQEMTVTKEMCDMAKEVKTELMNIETVVS